MIAQASRSIACALLEIADVSPETTLHSERMEPRELTFTELSRGYIRKNAARVNSRQGVGRFAARLQGGIAVEGLRRRDCAARGARGLTPASLCYVNGL